VFTPFRNAWWRAYRDAPRGAARAPRLKPAIPGVHGEDWPRAVETTAGPELPPAGEHAARRRLSRFLETRVHDYAEARDFPAIDGTSRLSAHLRLGVLSVRTCFDQALARAEREPAARQGVEKWLDELVWREFYAALRAERPEIAHANLRSEYDTLEWNDDPEGFAAWQMGRTGFPIVDAGMRQLAQTGWMHNRVRMIVASFLVKDLMIPWQRGAEWFLDTLVDADLANNSASWQWVAGCGTDAAPYFRIFNPVTQANKFDPDGAYVRRWVPELSQGSYPGPIVDHQAARKRALEAYDSIKGIRISKSAPTRGVLSSSSEPPCAVATRDAR
jgi:deoxyribodipyrimidine photo-lyase